MSAFPVVGWSYPYSACWLRELSPAPVFWGGAVLSLGTTPGSAAGPAKHNVSMMTVAGAARGLSPALGILTNGPRRLSGGALARQGLGAGMYV